MIYKPETNIRAIVRIVTSASCIKGDDMIKKIPHNPTEVVSVALMTAYEHFNQELFGDKLHSCLVHLHRKAKSYGYFAGDRFGNAEGTVKVDEIALNPSHFKDRTAEEVLSTLVHEMCHLWQHKYGKARKPGYHDKEWAGMMKDVGLYPSSTGKAGGKETGQRVSHYIIEGGDYAVSVAALLAKGYKLPYVELWNTDRKTAARKAASKTKYQCPSCHANAWAKPDTALVCGECREDMEVA